jgi:hypothetical protein
VTQNVKPSAILAFDQGADHSSVPAKFRTAVPRISDQRRPSGRRVSTSLLAAAGTMTALRFLRSMLCAVMVLAAPISSCGAAHAGQALPATHRASDKSFHPFAAFVTEASRRFSVPEQWIRSVMRVESSEKSRARSRKGRNGPDADHAKDLDCIARSARSRRRSRRSP